MTDEVPTDHLKQMVFEPSRIVRQKRVMVEAAGIEPASKGCDQ